DRNSARSDRRDPERSSRPLPGLDAARAIVELLVVEILRRNGREQAVQRWRSDGLRNDLAPFGPQIQRRAFLEVGILGNAARNADRERVSPLAYGRQHVSSESCGRGPRWTRLAHFISRKYIH